MMRAAAVFLLLQGAAITVSGDLRPEMLGCPQGPGLAEGARQVDNAVVEIRHPGFGEGGKERYDCTARVTDEAGRLCFEIHADVLWLDPVSGGDINDDGIADIVIVESDPVGYLYSVVTPPLKPSLVRQIRNGYAVRFERSPKGRIVLVVPDDGFRDRRDLIDMRRHELVVPEIRFEMTGSRLRDVGAENPGPYDNAIAQARAGLARGDIASFRAGRIGDEHRREAVKARVLTVVLSYFYSGRGKDAVKALSDMWPPADYERILDAILDARRRGSLRLAN